MKVYLYEVCQGNWEVQGVFATEALADAYHNQSHAGGPFPTYRVREFDVVTVVPAGPPCEHPTSTTKHGFPQCAQCGEILPRTEEPCGHDYPTVPVATPEGGIIHKCARCWHERPGAVRMKVYLYETFEDICVKNGWGHNIPTGDGHWVTMKVFVTGAAAREFNLGLPEYYHGRERSGWRIREMEVECRATAATPAPA